MKKFFALLALVLGVVSCQTEPEGFDVNAGGEVDTVISIAIPEAETRAGGLNSAVGAFENEVLDGDLTMRYICEVHYGTQKKTLETQYSDGKTVQFPVRLIPNREYRFVVWADIVNETDKADIHYNTADLTNITLKDDTWVAMDETRDAYFCSESHTFTGAGDITLTLKRPFAKVRVITTDMAELLGVVPAYAKVEYTTPYYSTFNAKTGEVTTENDKKNHEFAIATYGDNKENESKVLFTDYFFATVGQEAVQFVLSVYEDDSWAEDKLIKTTEFNTTIPVRRNYLTTIQGNILTVGDEITVEVEDAFDGNIDFDVEEDTITTTVNTAEEFVAAFEDSNIDVVVLNEDINLDELFSRAAFTAYTLESGRTLTIDLNGKTLSGTTTENSGTQELFLVKGNLTFKNGTILYEHKGENMGWNSMTTIFDVTAGGVLNLEGVTAKNLGGSDMGFVAHLNNWGEVTLNVENCTLESNYVPVRVFNSGPDMNNVTIKNSTLKGVSAAFWVHNYTVEDFGTEAKAEAQKALLNLNIYNQGNTFSPDLNGIRYGFTNSVRTDAYGITKSVSEDGTEVTLGSIVENGLVRRGVAGDEENTTIKKVIVEEGVGVLYDRTFRRFYALEEVVLPSTLTTIGAAGSGVFQSCNNLKTIVLPESVTVLGEGAFQECASLESINIPSGVTRIEKNVFRNTGLTSVEFHAGVTYFGNYAFRDCEELTEIIINAPTFTVESDTFLNAAGPFAAYVIKVANAEMKAYLESRLSAHQKTFITIVAPEVVNTTDELQAALAKGKDVVLANDLTINNDEGITAPYGNKTALSQNGGVFDGNGKTITANLPGDNYIYMTNGGTTKDLNVTGAFRGVMIMSPTQTVYLENVVSGGKGVVYALNTGEGNSTQDLVATNCTFNGWSSWSLLKSATFTNCRFGQGSEYSNVTGRLGKPYVNTVFEGCNFCSKYYIDLSALCEGHKVTLKNCTVNGMKITANNWTRLVAPEDTCGEGQISVELKNGTYLTAENVADYIIFE